MNDIDIGANEATTARALRVIEAVGALGMTYREAAAHVNMPLSTVKSLMARDDVKAYMQQMQSAAAKKVDVTRERVMEGMLEAIEHARLVGEPGTEIRGWEALAKMQGYNAPEKHIHDLPEDTKELLESLRSVNDRELAEMAGATNLLELTEDDYKVIDD